MTFNAAAVLASIGIPVGYAIVLNIVANLLEKYSKMRLFLMWTGVSILIYIFINLAAYVTKGRPSNEDISFLLFLLISDLVAYFLFLICLFTYKPHDLDLNLDDE